MTATPLCCRCRRPTHRLPDNLWAGRVYRFGQRRSLYWNRLEVWGEVTRCLHCGLLRHYATSRGERLEQAIAREVAALGPDRVFCPEASRDASTFLIYQLADLFVRRGR